MILPDLSDKNKVNVLNTTEIDNLSIFTTAISGATGGALLGSSFGVPGAIIGGIVGTFITGWADYNHQNKRKSKLHLHHYKKNP